MKSKIYLVVITLAFLGVCLNTGITQNLKENPAKQMSNSELDWKGAWPYGPAEAMDADSNRNLVFMSSGGAVAILDVADPAAPTLVNKDVRTRGYVEDICYVYESELLFLACEEGGMDIWDVENPDNPQLLSRTEIIYADVEVPVWNIDVEGDYAIAACDWGLLHSIDISDPTNPVDVFITGLQGDEAHNVHIASDNYVYVTGDEHFQRYTINGDGTLNDAGQYGYYTYGPYEVYGTPGVAYYDLQGDLVVFNTNNFYPYTTIDLNGVSDVKARGSYVYINNEDGLNIYNVSNPQNPQFVGNHPINSFNGHQITLFGQHVYIADRTHGMMVVNIADPANPQQVGLYEDTPFVASVEKHGDLLYLADYRGGMQIVNVNPPDTTASHRIGEVLTEGITYDVELDGDYAYLASWTGGFSVIDITDPENPMEIGNDQSIDAWRVKVAGNTAFLIEAIANESFKIWSFDITDKNNPTPINSLLMPDEVNDFFLDGSYLYCAGGESGTHIVDVSDPQDMSIAATYPSPDALDVFVSGNYAYVLDFDYNNNQDFTGALEIIDISDPTNPEFAGDYYDNNFSPWDVYVEGEYAVLTEGAPNNVVMLFNVSDPANPYIEDEFDTPGDGIDIMTHQGHVYLADGSTGLQILTKPVASQQMMLNSGYQFISSYMEANNPDLMYLCEDLMYDETLDFARDSDGSMLQKIGPNWVNNIGDWSTLEGYLFKMFNNDEFMVDGSAIDPQTPMPLEAGHTFISYLPHTPIDALEAAETILDNLDFMRDSEGATLQKVGPNWVNNIGDMAPGEGYLVRMNGADELVYPASGTKSSRPANAEPSYYTFNGGNPADPVYTMYLQPGNGIEKGDEVAAYQHGKLVGAGVIIKGDAFNNDLAIFSTLTEGKGYKAGQHISLRLYDKSKNQEYELSVEFENPYGDAHTSLYAPEGDGAYSIAKISKSSAGIVHAEGMKLYPNPANKVVHLMAPTSMQQVSIYNYSGKLIRKVVPAKSNIDVDISTLESGIYLFRIYTETEQINRKVIVE